MLNTLNSGWWALILRGVISALFGVLAVAWPRLDVSTLAQLFGAFAIVDGVCALILTIVSRAEYERWWLFIAEGIVSIVAGAFTIVANVSIIETTLLAVIAVRALVSGGVEIVAAYALRKEVETEWLLAISSFMLLVFGVIVLLYPKTGLLLAAAVGVFAMYYGVMSMVLGWQARIGQLKRTHRAP